ncbi:MAG TPA: TIGR03086 family metal-binding protein [Thermomonospora sp.]|nr:TIGR03086 family metal-binding protein [Thermomonospora sp.]
MSGGIALLERAVTYTLGALAAVTPDALSRPTPCAGWDLRALLVHLNDGLVALHEAVELGHIAVDPPPGDRPGDGADLVSVVRANATGLLGAWTHAEGPGKVMIADLPITAAIVTSTGAVEIAVHGWDVARACGVRKPIPDALAEQLLPLSALLVTDQDRPVRFAAPVPLPASANPADLLLAHLGRDPS